MQRAGFVVIGLILLVSAVFGQTFAFDFINYDDTDHVSNSMEFRQGLSPAGMRWAFTTTQVGNYIPLTTLSFLANFEMHGFRPGGYHATNFVMHAISTVLLFLFLWRSTRAIWPSAIVAALFAVHPLRAESVVWISSRKDVLCGLFWMLTLHAYLTYARRPSVLRYVPVVLSVTAALLSKPMAVTLPFVLLLLDGWPLRRLRFESAVLQDSLPPRASVGRCLVEKLPLLVPVVVISLVTMRVQRDSGAVSSIEVLPLSWRIENAIVSYAAYLWKSIWPVDLIPMYPFPENGVPTSHVVLAGLVLAAITIGVVLAAKRAPWAVVGWCWYLGTLVPVIGLVQVGAQSMADRYTYLPQIGVLIMVVWPLYALAERMPRMRWATVVAVAAIVAVCAVATYRQTQYWRDSVTLWSHAVKVTPDSVIARSSLGEAYLQRDELDAARRELEAAIRIMPTHRMTRLNLALVAIRQGKLDEAFLYCRAMTIEWPEDPDANTAWGSALIRYGLYEPALERLDLALRTNPNHAEALSNRGAALLMLGRNAEALATLQRAVEFAPHDPVILTNLAAAHYALDEMDAARRFVGEALHRDATYERALALQRRLANTSQ